MAPSDLWKDCLDFAALSDIGLRRANNQDNFAILLASSQADFDHRGHVFMVADGMGAHAAGELASKIAAVVIPLSYYKLQDVPPPEALCAAIVDANNQIHTRGMASSDFKGMGTTTSVLTFVPAGAFIGHVGDSRVYRLRGSKFEQLTFDYSLVWEIKAAGQQIEEQFAGMVSKNIITRSLGPNPTVTVDIEGPHPLEPGDTFLLCSDGLSGQVTDEEMGTILYCLPPQQAVESLIHLANLRGGPDNITIIVAKVLGPQRISAGNGSSASKTPRRHREVHPVLWTVLGVAVLATVLFLLLGKLPLAVICLVVAFGSGVAAAVQHFATVDDSWSSDGQFWGRGPYVTVDATPNTDFCNTITHVLEKLHDAAREEKWEVNWSLLESTFQRAENAKETGDFSSAAREYLITLNLLMNEIKKQNSE